MCTVEVSVLMLSNDREILMHKIKAMSYAKPSIVYHNNNFIVQS